MAFDPTRTDTAHLLEIDLGASTLKYADRDIALSDATLYEGRIVRLPPLSQSIGGLLDSRLITPRVRVTLDNTDDAIRTSLDANSNWAGKAVTIKIGQGTTAGDYETRFTGTVRFPGGVSWDGDQVTIEFDNDLAADTVSLPTNKIFPSTYPNAADSAKYQPIPIIYGDWRSTAAGGETVPCYQVDSTAGTGGKFKICEAGWVQEIEAVYLNGTDITANCTLDTANGEFTITTGTYDDLTDAVTANVWGKQITNNATYTLSDIALDLLENVLSVPSGRINSAGFTAWRGELVPDGKGRRWIGAAVASSTLLAELANEGFTDLIINEDGEYEPVSRSQTRSGATVVREFNILPRGRGRAFNVAFDPEKAYANQIVVDYALRPAGTYARSYDQDDSNAQTAVGQTVRRRVKSNWLYLDEGAESLAGWQLAAFASEPEMFEAELNADILALRPTDRLEVIYSKFEVDSTTGTIFQIRQIQPDYQKMTARVAAWNIDAIVPRQWGDVSANVYGSATATELALNAFWGDSNGRADSGDANSAFSDWY